MRSLKKRDPEDNRSADALAYIIGMEELGVSQT
jgi:hypothetical protein